MTHTIFFIRRWTKKHSLVTNPHSCSPQAPRAATDAIIHAVPLDKHSDRVTDTHNDTDTINRHHCPPSQKIIQDAGGPSNIDIPDAAFKEESNAQSK